MRISFHGADQGVTGSCHMIECAGKRILVDCGMYQGGRELDEENAEPFGFDPASIDYLLLTHAHLDHCGRIPLLVKRGFKGEVISTAPSFELARLVLLDAASLQEEEAQYRQRKLARQGYGSAAEVEPLYTTLDALNSFERFGRRVAYRKPVEVARGIRATFYDAGHILGSASILLELEEKGRRHRVLFSGDLGYRGRAILRDPDIPPPADTVVMESTYGDRLHKELKPSVQELYDAINTTMARGGNVIIPTFALERTQEILYFLREGLDRRKIHSRLNVFLDSPMAISATEIFKHYPDCFDRDTLALIKKGKDPLGFPGLHYTRQTSESMAINSIDGGAVIMAGSGMCTGGRVRHHLKHNLWDRRSSVVFVGYAARGTLARRIIDGARVVTIFGEKISVNASIYTIGGFSAHADQKDLLDWHKKTGDPDVTYLVHGEEAAMAALEKRLRNTEVRMPQLGDGFSLR